MDSFAERIDYLCRKIGSAKELSERTGISLRAIAKYRGGESEPSRVNLLAIAEATKSDVGWLVSGQDVEKIPYINMPEQTIKMVGFASCSIRGWGKQTDMEQDFTFNIPDPNAYGVVAVGNSMLPMGIRQGAICIISPNSTVNKNDIVYVERQDGTASIKKFISRDQNSVTLQGWLEPEEEEKQKPYTDRLSLSIIKSIHPVLWIKSKPM